jgi:hypothetical protein
LLRNIKISPRSLGGEKCVGNNSLIRAHIRGLSLALGFGISSQGIRRVGGSSRRCFSEIHGSFHHRFVAQWESASMMTLVADKRVREGGMNYLVENTPLNQKTNLF